MHEFEFYLDAHKHCIDHGLEPETSIVRLSFRVWGVA